MWMQTGFDGDGNPKWEDIQNEDTNNPFWNQTDAGQARALNTTLEDYTTNRQRYMDQGRRAGMQGSSDFMSNLAPFGDGEGFSPMAALAAGGMGVFGNMFSGAGGGGLSAFGGDPSLMMEGMSGSGGIMEGFTGQLPGATGMNMNVSGRGDFLDFNDWGSFDPGGEGMATPQSASYAGGVASGGGGGQGNLISKIFGLSPENGNMAGKGLSAFANYLIGQNQKSEFMDLAKSASQRANPMDDPRRALFQQQANQYAQDPSTFFNSPLGQAYTQLIRQQGASTFAKSGNLTGTNDQMGAATIGALAGQYNPMMGNLAQFGGYTQPNNSGNIYANLGAQGINAGAESFRGIGQNLFGDSDFLGGNAGGNKGVNSFVNQITKSLFNPQ